MEYSNNFTCVMSKFKRLSMKESKVILLSLCLDSSSENVTRAMHMRGQPKRLSLYLRQMKEIWSFDIRFGFLGTFHSRDELSAVFLFDWAFVSFVLAWLFLVLPFIWFRECKKQTTTTTEMSTMAV